MNTVNTHEVAKQALEVVVNYMDRAEKIGISATISYGALRDIRNQLQVVFDYLDKLEK